MSFFKDYTKYDGLGLAQLIYEKQVHPKELIEAAISIIETKNPRINAVIYKMYDEAKKEANHSYLSKKPFYGVPFLVKDLLLDVKGHPTTGSSEFLRYHCASEDSKLTKKYKEAGLIILGKTNTPEFGILGVTESKMRGPCRNPWDIGYSPGGSSGGAAAAVASRMVPVAHGGDGGGSIRIPASSCGLFGLKPTPGRIPMGPSRSESWLGLVSEHVITRSVRDSAAVFDFTIESGPSCFFPNHPQSFLESMYHPPKKLRIGYCFTFYSEKIHNECQKAIEHSMKLCAELGHEVIPAKPFFNKEEMIRAMLIIMASCCSFELKEAASLLKKKLNPNEFELITWFLKTVGENISADDLVWAIQRHRALRMSAEQFFSEFDLLASPTMAFPPSEIGLMDLKGFEKIILSFIKWVPSQWILKKMLDELASTAMEKTSNTPFFNQIGYPAMSVPLYWTKDHLPIGTQFGAGWGREDLLFQVAHQLEQAQPWAHLQPPFSS